MNKWLKRIGIGIIIIIIGLFATYKVLIYKGVIMDIPSELAGDYMFFQELLEKYRTNNFYVLTVEDGKKLDIGIQAFNDYEVKYPQLLGLGYFLRANYREQKKELAGTLKDAQLARKWFMEVDEKHPANGDIYNMTAYTYHKFGLLDLAKEASTAALANYEYNNNIQRQAMVYNNFGTYEVSLNNLDQTLNYTSKAMDLWNKVEDETHDISQPSRTISLISEVYSLKGDNMLNAGEKAKAREWFEKALDTIQVVFEKENEFIENELFFQLANLYLGKTQIELKLNKSEEAQASILKAIKYSSKKEADIEHRMCKGISIVFLGEVYAQMGDFDLAFETIKKGIKLLNVPIDDFWQETLPDISTSLQFNFLQTALQSRARISWLYYKNQSKKKATLERVYKIHQQAIATLDSIKMGVVVDASVIGLNAKFIDVYYDAIKVANELYQQNQSPKYLEELFILSEQSRSFALKAGVNQRRKTKGKNKQTAISEQYDSLRQQVLILSAQYYHLQASDKNKDRLQKKLFSNKLALNDFILDCKNSKDKQKQKFYKNRLQFENTSLVGAQKQFCQDENTAIFSYLFGEVPLLLVITKNTAKVIQLELPKTWTDELAVYMESIRKDIKDEKGDREIAYTKAAHQLYQTLVEPGLIALELENITPKRLRLMPSGVLEGMNFAALITTSNPTASLKEQSYLGIELALNHIYFLDKKIQSKSVYPTKKAACFIAGNEDNNSNYDITTTSNIDQEEGIPRRLKYMAETAEKLAKENPELWKVYDNAPKDVFLAENKQYGLVYFIMHGNAKGSDPLGYTLAFNQKDANTYNYLSMAEIYGQDIEAALLILGSCETQSGQVANGEGIISMARAFYYSGCPGIVGTLCSVNDYATAQIHETLLPKILDGQEVDVALQEAYRVFLNNPENENFLSPYYWSNIISIGKTNYSDIFPLASNNN